MEFALLAPLLCLMLGVAVETGRVLISYRKFETVFAGVSRHIVRYPEYEKRSRDYAKPIPKTLFPEIDQASLNLVVVSLVKEGGILKEVFPPHVLFGVNPGIAWNATVKPANYAEDEAVVFVAAIYKYKPLFSVGTSFSLEFKKTAMILPPFSRKFPWNNGQVADKYVY